jgi:ADP-ribose pyrophosphatase YjhB (NUDIX family)
MKGHVRPFAIAVIWRQRTAAHPGQSDAILVAEGYDPHKAQVFYRPLGGTIEFGELGEQTVRRELREEVGLELRDVRYLATIENVFTYRGEKGHEIVMVYSGQLADEAAWVYDQDEIPGVEDNGEPFVAYWIPVIDFELERAPLYPTGLLELLAK